jgi:hypothetical protein
MLALYVNEPKFAKTLLERIRHDAAADSVFAANYLMSLVSVAMNEPIGLTVKYITQEVDLVQDRLDKLTDRLDQNVFLHRVTEHAYAD